MQLGRRRIVIGLGLVTAGGLGVGSLAFTAVDADRDVTVQFEDDADALLGMEAARVTDYLAFEDDGVSGISIDILDVNRNARTRFDDLITFTNNGDNEITEISFEITEDNSENGSLEIPDGAESMGSLPSGRSEDGLSLVVETRDSEGFDGEPDIDAVIQITAETDA